MPDTKSSRKHDSSSSRNTWSSSERSSATETVGAHAMARDVNWRIIEDDEALPHFTRASQNIAVATALLRGLSEPATPEDHQAHREIRTLLEHVAAQQAKSLLPRRRELDASQRAPSE